MNTNGNLDESIGDRLKKSNASWGKIRNIIITNTNIDKTTDSAFYNINTKYIIIQSAYYHCE